MGEFKVGDRVKRYLTADELVPVAEATATGATVPPASTAGFTVPLCAYDEEQSFEWILDRMADAYQRGFKDGLNAQLTR